MNNTAHQVSDPLQDLALVAVFAAFIAVMSLASINFGGTVPITLQTFAIAATAMILGPWRGCGATVLYLLVGLAGLPVFANGASGPAVFTTPSGGYLISFPLFALLVGWLSTIIVRRSTRWQVVLLFLAGVVGNLVVVYTLGIVGLKLGLHTSWGKAFGINLAFIPLDLVKVAVAAVVSWTVLRAFPSLALGTAPSQATPEPAEITPTTGPAQPIHS